MRTPIGRSALTALAALAAATAPAAVAHAEGSAASYEQEVIPRAEDVGHVESVEVIAASSATASAAVAPASAVDIVIARGHFDDTLAKSPRGAPTPAGTVMAFTIDASTGAVLETYVGDDAPADPAGSAVKVQLRAPATATAARVHAARRHRETARAATWGNKCSQGEGHHCYAVATWEMSKGEKVEGTETEQYTTAIDVPGWASGDFVDNEEWAVFPPSFHWVEIGQSAGEYRNCCSLHWFYAYENSSGYHEASSWEVAPSSWNAYFMRSVGGGVWCFDVGPNGEEQIACVGGFPTYSEWLEDGAEIAANAQPTNAGSVVANATFTDGTVHTWNFASDELANGSGRVGYNGMCIAPFTPVDFPGNIYYGTYGECP